MGNVIAKVGDLVKYSGRTDYITGHLMRQYLKPGVYYEVSEVSLNYSGEVGNDYYRLKDTENNYWYACNCFDVDHRMVLIKKYGLR